MSATSPAAIWPISAALVLALDERLGLPLDSYVNGTQTWLTEDATGGATLEWRLHPVGGYAPPKGVSHHDLWDVGVTALRAGAPPDALPRGAERRSLASLWDGLEAFPGFGDEVEPARLAAACTESLGLAPDVFGLVNHSAPADEWERSGGQVSVVDLLLAQLRTS